ncbi:MAG: hypothetical protein GY801_02255 [bacterium]|nr:hypothetical protein [bacterium]
MFAANPGDSENISFLQNGVTAHRGNSSEYPQNTIAAFESAISIGADWIELDIHKTQDEKLVVIHDETTKSVGDIDVTIAQALYDELKLIDVASTFRQSRNLSYGQCPQARVPLLSEVIELIASQNCTRVSIQPKASCVKEAIELIQRMKAEAWVGMNDDSLSKMKQVKQLDQSIPVFWDRSADIDLEKELRLARQFGFEYMGLEQSGITQAKIEKIHQADMNAGAWTVNDPQRMEFLLQAGVDRIYTDNPKLLLAILDKRQ